MSICQDIQLVSTCFFFFFFFFLLNNFLEIYSCRVKQIFKSRLYEVCENLCVEPIDIIKYIRIQSRARWIHERDVQLFQRVSYIIYIFLGSYFARKTSKGYGKDKD